MNIKKLIHSYLCNYKSINKLIDELSADGNLFFIGGFLRCLLESSSEKPRDIDIIVKIDSQSLNKIVNKYNHKKNRFDGYKLFIDNMQLDIWAFDTTWAFKNNLVEAQEHNIVKTVFLNVDSVVFDYNNNTLYNDAYEQFLKNKLMDVILEDTPFLELNILRAIFFKDKYHATFSEKITNLISQAYHKNKKTFINKMYNAQASHYNNMRFTENDLDNTIKCIVTHHF